MTKPITWDEMKALRPMPESELAEAIEAQYSKIRAHNLRELRKSCNYTQVELAKQINVSQTQISKLERGDISTCQISTLQKYVEALGGKLRIEVDLGAKAYFLS